MPLNPDAILAHRFETQTQCVRDTEAMLYALSIGLGRDPLDAAELRYVYEDGLAIFPTMPIVLGHPGPWMNDPALGIDRRMLVHGTQRLEIHAALQVGRPFLADNRVLELVDKGAATGGLVVMERTLRDAGSGALLARMESGIFCRADGGFGGRREASRAFRAMPGRAPDAAVEMRTEPNQALWYRLNGDRNPLHASPGFAARAGFARPILHGLCTYSMVAHGLSRLRPSGTLRVIEGRFSKPVLPGDAIRVEAWNEPDGLAFRASVAERDAVVLDRGFARFDD